MLNDAEDGIDEKNFSAKITDVGKLLTEIFYQQSETKRAFIMPRFTKTTQEVLKKCKPIKYLFGDDLASKIKGVKDTDRLFNDLTSERNVPKHQPTKPSGNTRRPSGKRSLSHKKSNTGSQGQQRQKFYLKRSTQWDQNYQNYQKATQGPPPSNLPRSQED